MKNDINTVIDVKDASIFHRYSTILNNVNFKINKGEFVLGRDDVFIETPKQNDVA